MIRGAIIAGGSVLIKSERIHGQINIKGCGGCRERPKFAVAEGFARSSYRRLIGAQ
jgi:hypothetical protein